MSKIIRGAGMGRLALTIETGERIKIDLDGREVWVSLSDTRRGRATLLFSAPRDIDIVREKLLERRSSQSPST